MNGMPSLRVCSFNTHAGRDLANLPVLWNEAKALHEVGADVILLQEVDVHTNRTHDVHQAREIAAMAGYPYWAFGAVMHYDGGCYGNAILSRLPLLRVTSWEFPPIPAGAETHLDGKTRDWVVKHEGRGAISADVEWFGETVSLTSAHLSLFESERRAGAMMLGRVLSSPAIVGVDTNEPAPESLFPGWRCCTGTELTYPDDNPQWRIDAIFAKGFRELSHEVVAGCGSDHRMLVADVALSPEPSE